MKRLAILILAFLMVATLLMGIDYFDTEWQPGPGDKTYLRWETQEGILYVDSTAKRDSSQILTGFYGADSVRIIRSAVGATDDVNDYDSIFLEAHTVDWYGNWTLSDTIMKLAVANVANGLDTVYWAGCRNSPGIAFLIRVVGTSETPDSVQIIVSGVWTH